MAEIDRAVEILRRGGVVAFATETVYGLGADARNSDAVRRIFAAKGRPASNPLIVHVSGVAMAKRYAARWPHAARVLAQSLWPGPLTLVLPKTKDIVDEVTAGLDTVALRMPDHPLALELIRRFDGPIAAPSANRSTRVSPTTAEHVRQELGDAVDMILDGGPCTVGIESTVLDLSGERSIILRPGGVSRERIERLIGAVEVQKPPATEVASPQGAREEQAAKSPGMQEVHYAPRTPAYRFERGAEAAREADAIVIVRGEDEQVHRSGERIIMPRDVEGYARQLYAVLREADAAGKQAILVEIPPDEPQWLAVRDRLMRATKPLPRRA
jgi:L-threonylcarbamoyladenylate synthase